MNSVNYILIILLLIYSISLKSKENFTQNCGQCLDSYMQNNKMQSPCKIGPVIIPRSGILSNMRKDINDIYNDDEKLYHFINNCPMCDEYEYENEILNELYDQCCDNDIYNSNKSLMCNYKKDHKCVGEFISDDSLQDFFKFLKFSKKCLKKKNR